MTVMRCERCNRFIGPDSCLEGHDGTFFGRTPGSDGYTGLYYCAEGRGCQVPDSITHDCPRCYAQPGAPCFDTRGCWWGGWTEKGIAKLKSGWRPSYVRDKKTPHRERAR
jgi:hypothetical protein